MGWLALKTPPCSWSVCFSCRFHSDWYVFYISYDLSIYLSQFCFPYQNLGGWSFVLWILLSQTLSSWALVLVGLDRGLERVEFWKSGNISMILFPSIVNSVVLIKSKSLLVVWLQRLGKMMFCLSVLGKAFYLYTSSCSNLYVSN